MERCRNHHTKPLQHVGLMIGAIALAACSQRPYVVPPARDSTQVIRSHPIVVVNHGWHTGLIVPAEFLNSEIPELGERFDRADYYEIGWGDDAFYQAEDITAGLAIQALFASRGSVIHVAAISGPPDEAFQNHELVSTCLTRQQMASLSTYLASSFSLKSEGHAIQLSPGLYGDSQFYRAAGTYRLWHTCNQWTAQGLRSAGMDVAPVFSLTAAGLIGATRELRQDCSPQPEQGMSKNSH